jgi:hypothetical protein
MRSGQDENHLKDHRRQEEGDEERHSEGHQSCNREAARWETPGDANRNRFQVVQFMYLTLSVPACKVHIVSYRIATCIALGCPCPDHNGKVLLTIT